VGRKMVDSWDTQKGWSRDGKGLWEEKWWIHGTLRRDEVGTGKRDEVGTGKRDEVGTGKGCGKKNGGFMGHSEGMK